jgi:hypothetical protein
MGAFSERTKGYTAPLMLSPITPRASMAAPQVIQKLDWKARCVTIALLMATDKTTPSILMVSLRYQNFTASGGGASGHGTLP